MSKQTTHKSRHIVERVFVRGTLELITPTYLGNGDDDPSVDLPLLTDPLTGRALLTGASLTGALRNYLGECLGHKKEAEKLVAKLFGGARQNDKGEQSLLIVEDALATSTQPPAVEDALMTSKQSPNVVLRDGVRLEATTRTAADSAKFDLQLLQAGTQFSLGFELIIREKDNAEELKQLLATTLAGLTKQEIHLGGRKRRGYGQCTVKDWQVVSYDLRTAVGLQGWLQHSPEFTGEGLKQLGALHPFRRHRLTIEADFAIDGSVLIRTETRQGADFIHLQGKIAGKDGPILSGTSLAGVIRAQAGRIARTLHGEKAEPLLNTLFGTLLEEKNKQATATASKVAVREVPIAGGTAVVQSRVAIDRFTGGALETALFAEQPHFGGGFTLYLAVARPEPHQMGLLLLVLRDLWTGFTPIGGESSVGRGRLQGRKATITYEQPDQKAAVAVIEQKAGEELAVQNAALLEDWVAALHAYGQGGTTDAKA